MGRFEVNRSDLRNCLAAMMDRLRLLHIHTMPPIASIAKRLAIGPWLLLGFSLACNVAMAVVLLRQNDQTKNFGDHGLGKGGSKSLLLCWELGMLMNP